MTDENGSMTGAVEWAVADDGDAERPTLVSFCRETCERARVY